MKKIKLTEIVPFDKEDHNELMKKVEAIDINRTDANDLREFNDWLLKIFSMYDTDVDKSVNYLEQIDLIHCYGYRNVEFSIALWLRDSKHIKVKKEAKNIINTHLPEKKEVEKIINAHLPEHNRTGFYKLEFNGSEDFELHNVTKEMKKEILKKIKETL